MISRLFQFALICITLAGPLRAQEVSPTSIQEARHVHSSDVDPEADSVIVVLVKAAKERTLHEVTYNGSYFSISYPNGDIPSKSCPPTAFV